MASPAGNDPRQVIPKTVMAFDFGLRRVGVAVGNTLTQTAEPVGVISYQSKDHLLTAIDKLLTQWAPEALVVGLPTHPDGQAHEMTARARHFANQLRGRFGLLVNLVDERYSSAVVEGGQDDLAAAIILEQYFREL